MKQILKEEKFYAIKKRVATLIEKQKSREYKVRIIANGRIVGEAKLKRLTDLLDQTICIRGYTGGAVLTVSKWSVK